MQKNCLFSLFIVVFCFSFFIKVYYANGKELEMEDLRVKTQNLFAFITKEIKGTTYNFDDINFRESLKNKIVIQIENAMNVKDYNQQYTILRTARKNTKKFPEGHKFILDNSEQIKDMLDELSREIKDRHSDVVKPEKTVMFSQMESFISNCDIDEVTNRSNIDGVFGYSGIEDELSKVKSNIESYEELKAENKILKNQDQNNQRRLQEVMEREITLKLENEKMKERIRELEEQQSNAKNFDNLHNLYKQITGLYQKLLKSKDDFESIIKLRKQIEKEENNEKK